MRREYHQSLWFHEPHLRGHGASEPWLRGQVGRLIEQRERENKEDRGVLQMSTIYKNGRHVSVASRK